EDEDAGDDGGDGPRLEKSTWGREFTTGTARSGLHCQQLLELMCRRSSLARRHSAIEDRTSIEAQIGGVLCKRLWTIGLHHSAAVRGIGGGAGSSELSPAGSRQPFSS